MEPPAPRPPAQRKRRTGERLGPYEILEHLEQGGMGDVYHAVRVEGFRAVEGQNLAGVKRDTYKAID